ncbi:ABC transporter substrate-binding protein [Pseudoroseicyclus sp. CXY001]|uniref:ABC transporter substrate-binding protein n=1 Tax=Pseudoroseicyclus sp. CXY001 TaxID=3242492 RepID=UPI003570B43E
MQRFHTGSVSRRGLLKGAAAAGLILPAGMRAAQAQEAKRGGTFRLGLGHGSSADSLDPALYTQLFDQVFANALHNYLIEVAADGQIVPELATDWMSDDAITWVFPIREGVTYHDGRTVMPADVVASINHHRGEESTSAVKPYLEAIQDISVDGQNVVVTLAAADADFPYILSDYHLPILPSTDGKIDPTSPVGCGPYVYESFEPGVQASLTRNPDYWKSDRAWFDRVEILVILDGAARLNALLTGEVDAVDQVEPATIPMLEARGIASVLSIPGNAHYVFPMDSRVAPFDDNNVRLALKYALDRQEMVDKILAGHGAVSNDNPIGPANRYFFADMEEKTYDPDKAKYYLQQSGLSSLDVTLSVADAAFAGAVDAGVLYSERAAAAGITINIDRVPNDGYWDNTWMQVPFCASYWGGRPTEDQMFSVAYATGAAWNDSFWSNERFDTLLLEARSELDEDKRREMYHEMQQIVSFEGAVVIPMYNNFIMGVANNVSTPETIGKNANIDGYRALERWWFA